MDMAKRLELYTEAPAYYLTFLMTKWLLLVVKWLVDAVTSGSHIFLTQYAKFISLNPLENTSAA